MKNLLITLGLAFLFTGFAGFTTIHSETDGTKTNAQEATVITLNDTVLTILEKSCLPCHGIDGKAKAKMKWNFEKMPDMKTSKQVSKLAKIVEKVEDGKMPTTKFVKKYPDRKLTEEDKKILIDWADGLAESLVK